MTKRDCCTWYRACVNCGHDGGDHHQEKGCLWPTCICREAVLMPADVGDGARPRLVSTKGGEKAPP